MHMRITLDINDEILETASRLTGITEKVTLVRLGLETLINRESSKRLARLGGLKKIYIQFREEGRQSHSRGFFSVDLD